SRASSGSRLNCGNRKLPGRLRTSHTTLISWRSSVPRKSDISWLECPSVNNPLDEGIEGFMNETQGHKNCSAFRKAIHSSPRKSCGYPVQPAPDRANHPPY